MNIGDEVVYVEKRQRNCSCVPNGPHHLLRTGVIHVVTAITHGCRCEEGPAIKLAGIPNSAPHIGWCRANFRKVVKDAHEACEAEFVTLLKRTKRKVEA